MNVHEIVVRNTSIFNFATLKIISVNNSKGIDGLIGRLKSDPYGSPRMASFLFDYDKWTKEDAENWVEEHARISDVFLGNNEIINLSEEDDGKTMKTKFDKRFDCELKDFNEKERSFTAIASTGSIDRDGDILEPSGVKLKNFRKNPVLLWSHDASALPIGKATDVRVEDNAIKFTPVFAPPEVNPFADQVFNMFKSGFLKAFSIRFDPIAFEDMPDEGKGIRRFGRRFTKFELLEISAVNVPANPEALKVKDYQNFIVKSAMYENGIKDETRMGKIVNPIAYNTEIDLTEKEEKLQELKEEKEQIGIIKDKEKRESEMDAEIKKLEEEIEIFRLSEKAKKITKEVQDGITALEQK
jgi:HK97 family phage prohead protease